MIRLAIRLALLAAFGTAAAAAPDTDVADRFQHLTRATVWTQVAAIPLKFPAFHPQGMVRIGDVFYISSVEIRQGPAKFGTPVSGYDRDPGVGIGHLFKVGPNGDLLADLVLGEGTIYHPGGIDFDGRSILVPVSEYRPDSRAIIYRVDPATMRATELLRADDHIGAVTYDRDDRSLHGASWGSRRFYRWTSGHPTAPGKRPNPVQYIDYQDCHYAGSHRMLCGGIGEYRTAAGTPVFPLGGIDLVDLKSGRLLWQVPIEQRSPTGRVMTQNPFFAEAVGPGLRIWYAPDDNTTTLYAFEAALD